MGPILERHEQLLKYLEDYVTDKLGFSLKSISNEAEYQDCLLMSHCRTLPDITVGSRDVHSGQSGRAAERVPRSGPLTNVRAAEPEPTLVRL